MDFAVIEFNAYPTYLAATRQRPPYVPDRYEWPPKWVSDTGRDGRMKINRVQFLKFIMILHLLGAKGLHNANLNDLFSNNPITREEWLCRLTTRRELGRFLRQVRCSVV